MNLKESKVLVIEDNLGDAILMQDALSSAGIKLKNVVVEKSLSASKRKLEQDDFDLIFLDLGLPDCKYDDTVNNLLKFHSKAPVIVVTGLDDESVEMDSMLNGVQDYIIKGTYDSYSLSHSIKYALLRFEHEKNLKEINDFKNKLFRIISHDLKGPIGSLYMFVQMCLDDLDSLAKEDIKEDLVRMEDISKSLMNLIENLFNWAKIQVGSIEVKPEKIDCFNLVEENINLCKFQSINKNISIKNHIPQDLIAYADIEMVKTVLRNLICNAIKFTNQFGNIKIIGKNFNGYNEISVADNGIGIEEENLDRIFGHDFSVLKTGTNHEKGSGLGLNLCKEFVEINKGKIWVNSEFGKGSTFTFTLPSYQKAVL